MSNLTKWAASQKGRPFPGGQAAMRQFADGTTAVIVKIQGERGYVIYDADMVCTGVVYDSLDALSKAKIN